MPNNKYKKINEPFQRSMGSSWGPPPEIPCVDIRKIQSSSRHVEINQSNKITLNRPDSSAEIPQKFDLSESVTHSPRNEFEIEPQIPTSPASERAHLDVFTPHHTPDSTSLHYPDPSDKPQKFDPSEFVPRLPRNEFETEPQITVTPTSVLVNFDASTSRPHLPDVCFLPTFPTATNLLKSSSASTMAVDAKFCSVIKATPNITGSEWVCPPSEVGRDKK